MISNFGNSAANWPEETQSAFEDYVKNGGAFVSVHAANNSFGDWQEYNHMIGYGKGRVFHTTLGHDTDSCEGVGFIVTFTRGVEWAATGKVTQKIPSDFPTAQKATSRSFKLRN